MSRRVSWAGFFFQGGHPFPPTGGATAPHFFQKIFLAENTYFLIENILLILTSRNVSKNLAQGGLSPPGGYCPPFFQNIFFLQKIPKTKYILNQQHLVCLMSKKKVLKIWPRGGSAPHLREILCSQ